jgi:hypothetical protein
MMPADMSTPVIPEAPIVVPKIPALPIIPAAAPETTAAPVPIAVAPPARSAVIVAVLKYVPAIRGGPAQLDRNLVFLSEFSAG